MDHQDHTHEQKKLFIYHFEKGSCHLAELTATLVRWCQEGLVIKVGPMIGNFERATKRQDFSLIGMLLEKKGHSTVRCISDLYLKTGGTMDN